MEDREMKKTLLILTPVLVLLVLTSAPMISAISSPTALTPMEQLGKELFFDKIARPDNMSCADCHAPASGFTGPVPGINKFGAVYRGAVPQRFGNRKPPSAAYATLSPIFHYDEDEGLFVGGNFWDGRATGDYLGNPAADQALGPFLNPVEQNNPSIEAVLKQIAKSKYAELWKAVWGYPISYASDADVVQNYKRVGLAIAAYEASSEVNQFTSKYDYYLLGLVELSDEEEWGMELFAGKGLCAECHVMEGINGDLFTDFTFDNLGVPKNPDNPFYKMDTVLLDDGSPINPLGAEWIDYGLGGFLESIGNDKAAENMGKHKVPTLRNVDKRPGDGFPKAYMHNGVFKSLKEVVHFYNTRDVEGWPPPEVSENINTDELGDLGLTNDEENAIVAFMKTLSDGYVPTGSVSKKVADNPAEDQKGFPGEFQLYQNAPNPFNPVTSIQYNISIGAPTRVTLNVFDIRGSLVRTLVSQIGSPGYYTVQWNGTDNFGNPVSSGIYIYQLIAGEYIQSKRMLLVR
jgi:cytochrome c peroxidase